MAQNAPGILSWTMAVRTTLQNDPVRQSFEDQIQTHGFLFLDNYLEDILAGPKQEPIIELVKTPGRKKDAPKRTRAATVAAAKMKSVVSISLEDNDDDGKENIQPINSFHQALLDAKSEEKDSSSERVPHSPSRPQVTGRIVETPVTRASKTDKGKQKAAPVSETPTLPACPPQEDRPEVIQRARSPSTPGHLGSSSPSSQLHDDILLVRPEKELSIIAEDDEGAERSQSADPVVPVDEILCSPAASLAGNQEVASPTRQTPPCVPDEVANKVQENDEIQVFDEYTEDDSVQKLTVLTPTQTFHSFPDIDSPAYLRSVEHMTAPLPDMPRNSTVLFRDNDAATAPLPSMPSSDIMMVPLKEPASPAKALNRKGSIPHFPSLPAPSPLRKSMRIQREPSVGAGVLPTANATGPVVSMGSNRTSWLVKAREAKAIDGTAKRAHTPVDFGPELSLPQFSGGVKRKSDEMLTPVTTALGTNIHEADSERRTKLAKLSDEDVHVSKHQGKDSDARNLDVESQRSQENAPDTQTAPPKTNEESMSPYEDRILDRFKQTMEGLGRMGKSLGGKSLGGPAAAAALAEARAAAEAKVAERNKVQGSAEEVRPPSQAPVTVQPLETTESHVSPDPAVKTTFDPRTKPSSKDSDKRLSVSDLVGVHETRDKDRVPENVFRFVPLSAASKLKPSTTKTCDGNATVSTTPPNSPPLRRKPDLPAPSGPVFSRPPRVFIPPPSSQSQAKNNATISKDFGMPSINPFMLPPPSFLGLPAKPVFTQPPYEAQGSKVLLSAQSSAGSMFSDTDRERPSWMVSTQDTEYSSIGSQPQPPPRRIVNDFDEEDEQERLEKDFAKAHPNWTPFGFANQDDSDTWTTDPTESHKGDTGPILNASGHQDSRMNAKTEYVEDEDEDMHAQVDDKSLDTEYHDLDEQPSDELEEDDARILPTRPSDSISESKTADKMTTRSQSQMSMASSASSQMGFFGHAARLVTTALGSNKKKPEPVKSLQLAAVAAKKQQEEQEKKAARLREMENRRQQVQQKKAEEEKTRAMQQERRIKEDTERRKREREEQTDKRPLKANGKKADEDTTNKKRKLVDSEKKLESKKPNSKDKKDNLPRAAQNLATSQTTGKAATTKTATLKQAGASVAIEAGPSQAPIASSSKHLGLTKSKSATSLIEKGKAKGENTEEQSSRFQQPQAIVRAQEQLQGMRQQREPARPPVPSETIELPDINSEYSDSDDEDRKRTFDPPNWAQSPALRQALEMQSTVNPDDIFGAVRPLHMEEIFRTRQSRFRARTSSANWTGTDRLTIEEQIDYARRMGYR